MRAIAGILAYRSNRAEWVVPLLVFVRLFLLTRDRQIPSRAPDMAIRREQSSRGGTLQSNNTLQGDYHGVERCSKLSFSTWTTHC